RCAHVSRSAVEGALTIVLPPGWRLEDDAARAPQSRLPYLRERGFGLRQPEGHVYSAVQRDGRGQSGTGRLAPPGGGVQGAKPQVAVGLERAHARAAPPDVDGPHTRYAPPDPGHPCLGRWVPWRGP